MTTKTANTCCFVGAIIAACLSVFTVLFSLVWINIFRTMLQFHPGAQLMQQFKPELIVGIMIVIGIIGFIGSIVSFILVSNVKKLPTHNGYVALAIVGGLGMIFGMGVGGVLILIGGLIGV